jgi:hypothetical protein
MEASSEVDPADNGNGFQSAAFAGAPSIMLRCAPFLGVAERLRFLIAWCYLSG